MQDLIRAILEGDCAEAVSHAERLERCGTSPDQIVVEGVEAAMSALDAKCTIQEFNLLEIMLAGRAVTEVMKVLYPANRTRPGIKGTVLIASLEGDVHDLGKNILRMVLLANGYNVVDCGKDCPLDKLIETAQTEAPLAVGVSGLITSIVPQVKQVKDRLVRRGLGGVKVMAGGAALKQSSPGKLNVDFVGQSAFDSLHYLEGLRLP